MKRSRSIHDDIATKRVRSGTFENEPDSESTINNTSKEISPEAPTSITDKQSTSSDGTAISEKKDTAVKSDSKEESKNTDIDIKDDKKVNEDKDEAGNVSKESEEKADEKADEKAEKKTENVSAEKSEKEASHTESNDNSATKVNEKESKPADTEKPVSNTSTSKPKPSGFAGFASFSSFSNKSAFSTAFGSKLDSKDDKASQSNPWAEKTTNNPWAEKPEKSTSTKPSNESEDKKDDEEEETPETPVEKKDVFARVKLEKQEIKTGEENENTYDSVRARLYAVDPEAKAWKERGTGLLKLNEFIQGKEKRFRFVMRLDGVLRVSLNVPLFKNMQVSKGFANSLQTERFFRFSGIENGAAHQFAVKCPSEEARDTFYDSIKQCLESL